jgi:sugar-phosphatase
MTVWAVNAAAAVGGAHRHFASLRDAAPDILADLSASGPEGRRRLRECEAHPHPHHDAV